MTRRLGDELVVVTQNAWGGAAQWARRRDLMARKLGDLRPDVIGLQEVHARDARVPGVSQAHELADLLGGYDVTFAPGRVCDVSGECEGVALLLRCDARGHAVEALTLDKDDRWEGSSQRVVLCATLDLPEGIVDVFVTHMSLSARARKRTVLELCAFVDRERRRSGSIGAVLMGDLNATPDEACIAALETPTSEGGSWLDLWKHVHGPRVRGGTWPVVAPFRRIDYLFVQPLASFSVERCERLPFAGSDHCGVIARLRLAPPGVAPAVGMVAGESIA